MAAADVENAGPENGNAAVADKQPAVKKERARAIPRANREEYDAQLLALEAVIAGNTERIEAIKATINDRREARKLSSSGSSHLRSRVAELNAAFKQKLVRNNSP